jgi:hypothetical protein
MRRLRTDCKAGSLSSSLTIDAQSSDKGLGRVRKLVGLKK